MKAKTKEQYKKAWKSEVSAICGIGMDLPNDQLTEFLNTIDKLKSFVDIAADNLEIPEK